MAWQDHLACLKSTEGEERRFFWSQTVWPHHLFYAENKILTKKERYWAVELDWNKQFRISQFQNVIFTGQMYRNLNSIWQGNTMMKFRQTTWNVIFLFSLEYKWVTWQQCWGVTLDGLASNSHPEEFLVTSCLVCIAGGFVGMQRQNTQVESWATKLSSKAVGGMRQSAPFL